MSARAATPISRRGVLAGGLALLLAPRARAESGGVRIALALPLTGEDAQLGAEVRAGARLAADLWDGGAGLTGLEVGLVDTDLGSALQPAGPIDAFAGEVVAVVGPFSSSQAGVLGTRLSLQVTPMLTPTATSAGVTRAGDWVFRACPTDAALGRAMGAHARKGRGRKRLGIAAIDAPSGQALAAGFIEVVGEKRVRARTRITAGATNLERVVTTLQDARCEAVFAPTPAAEGVALARALRRAGFDGPLLGADGWDTPTFLSEGGDATFGARFVAPFAADDPAAEDFVLAADAAGVPITARAALGWDATRMVLTALAAVKKAHPRDWTDAVDAPRPASTAWLREAVRDRLAGLRDFASTSGPLRVDAEGDVERPVPLIELGEDGPTYLESL